MELLMRGVLFCFALAACTPEVVSGSYLCGPEATCPEDLVCDGAEDTCVLASMAEPFTCDPDTNLEPDDTSDEGFLIDPFGCASSFMNAECMLAEDSADWVTFVAPEQCSTAIAVQARLSFSVAWEVLGLELWDLDANMQLATDEECEQGADVRQVRRCLDHMLVPGTKYGVKVHPTGDGTCNGDCAYNRYSLSLQLGAP
jgi:hypothetical protein